MTFEELELKHDALFNDLKTVVTSFKAANPDIELGHQTFRAVFDSGTGQNVVKAHSAASAYVNGTKTVRVRED